MHRQQEHAHEGARLDASGVGDVRATDPSQLRKTRMTGQCTTGMELGGGAADWHVPGVGAWDTQSQAQQSPRSRKTRPARPAQNP